MADELAPFLSLTPTDALAQWERIRRREWPLPGRRQEDFLPVEVLLSYALFFLVNPHRYGGANIHTLPANVQLLAGVLKRSPGSLTSKMLNLDGSRANAGRLEPLLFAHLGTHPEDFDRSYARTLEGASAAGVVLDDVDVLGFEDGRLDLRGQDEISTTELSIALTESEGERQLLMSDMGLSERVTERVVEQRVRLGQHRFARDVLANFAFRCGFCGFRPDRLRGLGLVRASHVKPWAKSDAKERLSVGNGIAACPTHDVAFDGGLLFLTDALAIRQSRRLEESRKINPGVERLFGPEGLRATLLLPSDARAPTPALLEHHRQESLRRHGT